MNKLSHLIEYLNTLQALGVDRDHESARHAFDRMLHSVTNDANIHWSKMYRGLLENGRQLDQLYKDITHNVNVLANHCRNLIAEQESIYFRESQRLWEQDMRHETNEVVLSRRLITSDAAHQRLLGKVLSWSDWRYPGMIMAPGTQDWIEHLVALDPLYLVDRNLDLLQPAKSRFNPQYQRRLRLYTMDERRNNQAILADLPDQQFGLVFAYNYFNFRPYDTVCRMLSEIYTKLRPGGTLFFTYNDCDYAHGVRLCEQNFMCYTPGHRVRHHLETAGFTIVEQYHDTADLAWFEARRPGELDTMRAGQNLAKIVARSK